MKSDIIIIGGGASGLMAAWSAAKTASESGKPFLVTVLEKMPRPGRKIMLTGKGRCNFTNLKDWNDFRAHIRTNPNAVKPAFYNFTPHDAIDFFESYGMKTVVERGDRAFPASYRSTDVIDTLVNACNGYGVKFETEFEVSSVVKTDGGFAVTSSDGRTCSCSRLIIATGGLSYPVTGSTGDGYGWAKSFGHCIVPVFPSLTALVPAGYKNVTAASDDSASQGYSLKGHIDRSTPLSQTGGLLCGISLKNVGVSLFVEGTLAQQEQGDIDFTDGGIEGPIGFQISRKAVKSIVNGSKVSLSVDMKPGVELSELASRVKELWTAVDRDPRSAGLHEKEKCRILLGKLMPWDLIPAFRAMNPGIITLERKGRTQTKVWVNLPTIAKALKDWRFDIAGFVGYERAVVTAGGVNCSELVAKNMSSRLCEGLYFCGEVLDMDCDTGGYNLQLAFSTGVLAGSSAAASLA